MLDRVPGTMSFVGNFGSFKQKKNAFVPSGTPVPAGAVNRNVVCPFDPQVNVYPEMSYRLSSVGTK
jgi:hypothetical protein